MGETNEAKEPGQVACEAACGMPGRPGSWWASATDLTRRSWATAERAVLDHYAPRLATLEAETRDLHSKLAIANVAVETERQGRLEAERVRDVLSSEIGRAAAAAIVASVPAHDVKTQTALNNAIARAERAELETYALRKKLEASEARAEKAEHDYAVAKREREEERQQKIDMTVERNAARRARDDAIKTCAWLDKRVDEERALKESAIAGRNEARDEVAQLTQERASAKAAHDAWRARAERAEAEVARLNQLIASQPSAEATKPETPPSERKPPFRDWTIDALAKLVPGATVIWHNAGCHPPKRVTFRQWNDAKDFVYFAGDDTGGFLHNCDPLTIEPPATQTQRKPQLRAWTGEDKARLKPGASVLWYCNGRDKATRIVVRDVDNFGVDAEDEQGGFVSACFENMDPETIVDAPSVPMLRPDLCPGDVVKDRNGLREWKIAGVPEFAEWAQRWSVPVDDNGGTDYVWAEWLDLSTRMRFGAKTTEPAKLVAQAETVRPPAPDLRKGDKIVAQRSGLTRADRGEVLAAPTWANGEWHVKMCSTDLDGEYTSTVPTTWLDLSTRERTWQRGEVVPHAPTEITRQCSFAEAIRGSFAKEQYAALPLAESWTQKGV